MSSPCRVAVDLGARTFKITGKSCVVGFPELVRQGHLIPPDFSEKMKPQDGSCLHNKGFARVERGDLT